MTLSSHTHLSEQDAPLLSPHVRAIAYALQAGDREAAEQVSNLLLTEAPMEALTHFIDAQLAFSVQAWARLIRSARRCWQLGGQNSWIALMLGGTALRCHLTHLTLYLQNFSDEEITPLTQLPEEILPELTRILSEPLPPLRSKSSRNQTIDQQNQGSIDRSFSRFRSRVSIISNDPPEWIDRSMTQQFSSALTKADTLEWLDRSSTRIALTALQPNLLPDWMSIGTLEGESLTQGSFISTSQYTLDEGLSAGLQLCEGLELPLTPVLALPLPAPTLYQSQQEPRRLKGRFLLVAYSESLGLVDLSKPTKPWFFKKNELDEVRIELQVGQWVMSMIFSDMRMIQFEVSQGVSTTLDPYLEGGEAFKRWFANATP